MIQVLTLLEQTLVRPKHTIADIQTITTFIKTALDYSRLTKIRQWMHNSNTNNNGNLPKPWQTMSYPKLKFSSASGAHLLTIHVNIDWTNFSNILITFPKTS